MVETGHEDGIYDYWDLGWFSSCRRNGNENSTPGQYLLVGLEYDRRRMVGT